MTSFSWPAFVERMEAAGWVRTDPDVFRHGSMEYDAVGTFWVWIEDGLVPFRERAGKQVVPWTDYAEAGTTPAPW